MVLVATPITMTPAAGPPGMTFAAAAAFFFFSLCHWSRSHSPSAPSMGKLPGLWIAAQLFCGRARQPSVQHSPREHYCSSFARQSLSERTAIRPCGVGAAGTATLTRWIAFFCRIAVTSTGVLALTISSLGKAGIGRMLMYAVDSSAGIAGGNFLAYGRMNAAQRERQSERSA